MNLCEFLRPRQRTRIGGDSLAQTSKHLVRNRNAYHKSSHKEGDCTEANHHHHPWTPKPSGTRWWYRPQNQDRMKLTVFKEPVLHCGCAQDLGLRSGTKYLWGVPGNILRDCDSSQILGPRLSMKSLPHSWSSNCMHSAASFSSASLNPSYKWGQRLTFFSLCSILNI